MGINLSTGSQVPPPPLNNISTQGRSPPPSPTAVIITAGEGGGRGQGSRLNIFVKVVTMVKSKHIAWSTKLIQSVKYD